jgi:hypothetical protein
MQKRMGHDGEGEFLAVFVYALPIYQHITSAKQSPRGD